MLFKLTASDVQNTTFVDCATGAVAYKVSTWAPGARSRSLSASSLYSFASSSSSSRELCSPVHKITAVTDQSGECVAEVSWEETTATSIKLGEEILAGTSEIFDAAFVKVLPEETLIPTRMEYVWRTTPESLTLLDDDYEVIGRLYQDCLMLDGELCPVSKPGTGHDYLEMNTIPSGDLLELLVSFILITALRERMYWITKYVYGQRDNEETQTQRNPLRKLRKHASRSFANWKETVFRHRQRQQ